MKANVTLPALCTWAVPHTCFQECGVWAGKEGSLFRSQRSRVYLDHTWIKPWCKPPSLVFGVHYPRKQHATRQGERVKRHGQPAAARLGHAR